MINLKRAGALGAAALLIAGMVSGCATTGDGSSDGIAANDQPGQLAPVEDSSVSSNSLPPIGGSTPDTQVANAPPDQASLPPLSGAGANTGDPGLTTGSTGGQAGGSSSFVSLNDVGSVSNSPGRDLSGGLTMQKLLGGWTVVSGATQCRLNLTYTAMTGSSRYRASAPGCQLPALASVSSWQLSGTQLQLFDGSNAIIGALLLSGGHFIGTLAGGQAISMTG